MSSKSTLCKIAALSTNNGSFAPIGIIQQFFSSAIVYKVTYTKDVQVDFEQDLQDSHCHITYFEITNLQKCYSVCAYVDCFIIFADLEYKDTLVIMDEILSYIRDNNITCKVFVLGIYRDVKNIQDEFNEETIKEFLNSAKVFYDYYEINFNLIDELVRVIEKITQEVLELKKQNFRSISEEEEDKSNSRCLVW